MFLLLTTSAACAEDFSWQIAGGQLINELQGGSKTDTSSVEATYFFNGVDDELGPRALAPFLSRSSSVSPSFSRIQTHQRVAFTIPFTNERIVYDAVQATDVYAVEGRYVWGDSGWYVGGGLQYHDLPESPSTLSSIDSEKDGYKIIGGKYIGMSTAIELLINSTQQTIERSPAFNCLFPFPSSCASSGIFANTSTKTEEIAISARHVGGGSRLSYSISGGILERRNKFWSQTLLTAPANPSPAFPATSYGGTIAGGYQASGSTTGPTQREYSVAGEIFPTVALGIRVGYTSYSDIGQLDDRYELAASWFFRRSVAAEFVFAKTEFGFGISGASREEAAIRFSGRL